MVERITVVSLAKIRVLYRQTNTMSLWGIPYDMRADCGQQPYDLIRARDAYRPPRSGMGASPPVDLSDWLWLGCPGWFGGMSREARALVEAWLAERAEYIPEGPNEWCRLPYNG